MVPLLHVDVSIQTDGIYVMSWSVVLSNFSRPSLFVFKIEKSVRTLILISTNIGRNFANKLKEKMGALLSFTDD